MGRRYRAACLLIATGCAGAGSEPVAQSTGTETAGATTDATGEQPDSTSSTAGTTAEAESSDEGPSLPPQTCPGSGREFGDALVHRGRGQGDEFVEIVDVVTRNDIVYACTATQGLTIWDASAEGSVQGVPKLLIENVGPAELTSKIVPRCQHLALFGNEPLAAVAHHGDETSPTPWLVVYDLSDPGAPIRLRTWSGPESIEGVVVAGERIYAAAHRDGILAFENQGEDELGIVGRFSDDASDAWQVAVRGNTLFAAEGNTGLRAYGMTAPTPELLGTLALTGSSKDLAIAGDEIFVAASSSLFAVDASTPANMAILGERDTQGTAVGVALGGLGVVYVAEWDEIRAYDATSAELPLVWSEAVPTNEDFSRVLDVDADPKTGRVYAGEWTGMHAFSEVAGVSAPDLDTSPTSLQFGDIAAGEAQTRVVIVENTGTELLEVTDAYGSGTGTTVSPTCFDVEPGQAVAVEVRLQVDDNTPRTGTVTIEANDPDEPYRVIQFAANIQGLDIGDPVPEFLLQDTLGNTWDSSELSGNVVVLAYFATF